ncbi:hypothetical protein [Corynebacterium urinipleomorphum]|uniref:hypothetical protein n=1 Tax=Corynebacterium urinipleomorphum TaxID=1852380 RepID=UPI000B350D2A|nr:hypothetical protein [Corynebacterium urinipleomorphum]
MKRRFVAAGLAAATALSLSVAPAQAAPAKTSSEVSDGFMVAYVVASALTGNVTPSYKRMVETDTVPSALASSVRNDVFRGYPVGKTFDIILGTGIAALLLAGLGGFAVQQGLVKLP